MSGLPKHYHRQSTRLRGYDYAQDGIYFVTICVAHKQCLLGNVINTRVDLSPFGKIVDSCWQAIPSHFTDVSLDLYVLMPNHLHGILVVQKPPTYDDTVSNVGTSKQIQTDVGATHESPLPPADDSSLFPAKPGPQPRSLGAIVGLFKSACTNRINQKRQTPGEPFWQRNYHDRIVRDERELNRIRAYILNNPARWAEDAEYPF